MKGTAKANRLYRFYDSEMNLLHVSTVVNPGARYWWDQVRMITVEQVDWPVEEMMRARATEDPIY